MARGRRRVSAWDRQLAVDAMAATLTRNHSPRLTMLLIVACAAVVSFLSSALMLWMRVGYMPVRYALAGLFGYGMFLGLMNRLVGHHSKTSVLETATDVINPLDFADGVLGSGSRITRHAAEGVFRGGRSGGGGVSASFDAAGVAIPPPPVTLVSSPPVKSGSSKSSLLDVDLDDGVQVLPVLAVIAVVAGLVACASVIWSAPQMMAELMVDGAVAGAAYQRLRDSNRGWTLDVLRRTWLSATAVVMTFVVLGLAGHYFKPGADSIGDFFR